MEPSVHPPFRAIRCHECGPSCESSQVRSSAHLSLADYAAFATYAAAIRQLALFQPESQCLGQGSKSVEQTQEIRYQWIQLGDQLRVKMESKRPCDVAKRSTFREQLMRCARELCHTTDLLNVQRKLPMLQPSMELQEPSRTRFQPNRRSVGTRHGEPFSRLRLSYIRRDDSEAHSDIFSEIPLEQFPLFEANVGYEIAFTIGFPVNRGNFNPKLTEKAITVRPSAERTVEIYSCECDYVQYDVESPGLANVRMGLCFKKLTLPYQCNQQPTSTLTLSVFGWDLVQEMIVTNRAVINQVIRSYKIKRRGGRTNPPALLQAFKKISWSDYFFRSVMVQRAHQQITNCSGGFTACRSPRQKRKAVFRNVPLSGLLPVKRVRIAAASGTTNWPLPFCVSGPLRRSTSETLQTTERITTRNPGISPD